MKKLLFSLLFCVASPLFAADGKPFTVVTTFTVIADMAQNVAGEDAKVVSITKPVIDRLWFCEWCAKAYPMPNRNQP